MKCISGKGYDAGWSDEAVAKDLGIPRAWVTSVRDEMFGPAIADDDPRKLLEQISALSEVVDGMKQKAAANAEDLKAREKVWKEAADYINSMQSQIAGLHSREKKNADKLTEVSGQLEALARNAREMSKAIGKAA